jgi:glycosyltransferase involved in cell wall biosynthesis
MRITFLMPADDLTGGNRVVSIYARKLMERGHDVLVISNCADRPPIRERLQQWIRTPFRRRSLASPVKGHIAQSGVDHHTLERPRAIRDADVPDGDWVIATWWETARWMQDLSDRKGHKLHLIQGYETWGHPDLRQRVQATLQLPNRKIAISGSLKRDIESDLGELGIDVISNAVDLEQFDAPERDRNVSPQVGFVYAPGAMKGSDRYLQAIAKVRLRHPELKVMAFGAHEPHPDWPLPPDCHYIRCPEQALLATLYASCDAWLFASRIDSFGLPILEAMACRTPVIGAQIGAAPDLLQPDNGVLISADQDDEVVETLASAIQQVCYGIHADEWRNMSTNAHRLAHTYDWNAAVDRLEGILKEALPASHH